MSPVLGRRTLLGLLAGSGLGLLVGSCSDGGPSSQELVCGAVGDVPPGLVTIGTRYRELHPDDDPAIVGDGLSADDPSGSLASLRRRVQSDFESGDVVDVDGWVLARTEARAAALLSGC